MYHFVWVPKYRYKVFNEPYRKTLKAIIEKIGYDYDIEVLELGSTQRPYLYGCSRSSEDGAIRCDADRKAYISERIFPDLSED